MAKKSDRTIFTPRVSTADLANTGDRLVYWKQILPEAPIQYTDRGQTRTINFDRNYHRDVINAFHEKAVDQTCFQLANPLNGHGRDYDPERQRAEVLDMATLDELPDDVKAKVGNKPGLYAKMRFFDKKSAKAVEKNPNLGVSARVRENFVRADGKFVKRAVVHVLGTIDPRVTGMSAWQSADLSYDPDNGYVLDLSNATYEGNPVATKNKGKGSKDVDLGVSIPTDEEIDAMSDEELNQFLAEGEAALAAELADEDDDLDDEDDDDEEDDDLDDEDDDTQDDDTQEASLSTKHQRAIDLANAQAAQASQRANEALARQAQAEFTAYRTQLIMKGVPPEKIDLAQSVLARADDMVVDLSNTDDGDLNVTEVVRQLLEGYEGTIDMSNESGHSGTVDLAGGENDPDAEMLEAWDDIVPSGH
jgi:hypothetical protein